MSEAGLYLWASHPELDCWVPVDRLAQLGILVAPGDFYGPGGARHVRVALTATDERVGVAVSRTAEVAGSGGWLGLAPAATRLRGQRNRLVIDYRAWTGAGRGRRSTPGRSSRRNGPSSCPLRSLDASDWRRPTVCPGWRVHDVVAHVGHDYLRKLSRSRDRHPAPGPGRDEGLPAFLSRLNQEFVDVAACWSPAVLTDLLEHPARSWTSCGRRLDLGELGEPVSWAAPGEPAPHCFDVAREYTEYWVHQQQVRDAVGDPERTATP